MAGAVPALVISLEYRLAPEHRLPAAYDDAVEALLWVKAQTAAGDPWLSQGDFSRFFLMGSSSGANIAYQAGLRAVALDLDPIRLCGIILNQLYLGGIERTASELASEEDVILPLRANDMMWGLSLPEGADRSHEFCDLVVPPLPGLVKCLVMGRDGDPLIDRQRVFANMLEVAGVSVVARLEGKGFHAIEHFVPDKAQEVFDEVRKFICDTV